jgi:hypothetical protein
LLKVLLVSGKPFVIACTKTGDEMATRTKASNELSLFFFGIIGIPFYILFRQDFGVLGPMGKNSVTRQLSS